MKLLAIVIQNTKGKNMVVVTSNTISLSEATKWSLIIRQFILESYKYRQKVQRSFIIENDIICSCSITEEYILNIIATKNDLFLAYDASRKLNDYIFRVVKAENIPKKNLELTSLFEEFLYTRELSLPEPSFPLRPMPARKKQHQQETLNRFIHINSEQDRRLLLDSVAKSARIAAAEAQIQKQRREASRAFYIKVLDDLHIFEINKSKQNHIRSYKTNIFRSAMGNRKPRVDKVVEDIILIEEESEPSQIKSPSQTLPQKPEPSRPKSEEILIDEAESPLRKEPSKDLKLTNENAPPLTERPKVAPQLKLPEQKHHSKQPTQPVLRPDSKTKKPPEIPQPLFPIPQKKQPPTTPTTTTPQKPNGAVVTSSEKPTLNSTTSLNSVTSATSAKSATSASSDPSAPFFIRVKMNVPQRKIQEKLQLVQHDGKLKDFNQMGQVVLQGNQKEKVQLILVSDLWHNKRVAMTRLTPNSLKVHPISDSRFEVEVESESKQKGVIDYVLSKDSFSQDKIPLHFVYSQDTRKSSENAVEFVFRYKVNERWKDPLYDIEINVILDPNFIFSDCRTTPLANSLQEKRVNWKARQLADNSRGKLSLTFIDGNLPAKDIIKEIRLVMRSEKSLIKEMEACCEFSKGRTKAKRNLLIEYKIMPN